MFKKIGAPIILGVTGQVSTGKSTVAAMFAQLGGRVLNADLMAHHSIRPGGAGYAKVIKTFGPSILNGKLIDRGRLADLVFENEKALKKLERIIHPLVIKEMKRQIQELKKNSQRIIVLDVPLLFESGMDKLVDYTITVKTSAKVQKERCFAQGRWSSRQAKARIQRQWSMAQKMAKADLIIDNNSTLEKTQAQVKKIWDMLKRRKDN